MPPKGGGMNKHLSLVGIILASAVVVSCASSGQGESLTKVITRSGFSPVNPPADYIHPGTVILLTSRKPLEVSVVCPAHASLGEVELLESDTPSLAFVKAAGQELGVRVRLLHRFISSAKLRQISSISVVLYNPRVVEVPDTQVITGLPHRTEECWGAIRLRTRLRENITMVKKALFAEKVEYEVEFRHGATLNAQAKESLKQEIASKLELEQAAGGILHGENLYWGIIDDPDLVVTNETTLNRAVLESRPQQRSIPVHATVNLSPPQ